MSRYDRDEERRRNIQLVKTFLGWVYAGVIVGIPILIVGKLIFFPKNELATEIVINGVGFGLLAMVVITLLGGNPESID